MNTKNSKTSYPHDLLYNFTDKVNSRRGGKSVPLSHFSIYYT